MTEIETLQKKTDKLLSLIEVNTIVNSSLNLNEVIRLVMDKAQEVMNAEASSVFLLNGETNQLEIMAAFGKDENVTIDTTDSLKDKIKLELGQGFAGWVAQHRTSLNIADAQQDPRFFKLADKLTGFKTRNMLVAPLMAQDRLIGVAEVINRKDGSLFDNDDEQIFNTFCHSVAMAIENARLHQEIIEKERFLQQLESAKIIQQSFLPKSYPTCPLHRFEIYADYQPAREIGGDFYDFLVLDQDHLGIVIGDVSGKGIPAALYMARLISDFRLYTYLNLDLEQAFQTLNNILVERNQQGMFVTMMGAIYNAATGQLQFINAGHLPMLRISGQNKNVDRVGIASDIPLGIKMDRSYKQGTIRLKPGDYLVLLTDGITEIHRSEKHNMDLSQLEKMVSGKWQSPQQIIEYIHNKLRQLTNNKPQHDDMTLVVLKRC